MQAIHRAMNEANKKLPTGEERTDKSCKLQSLTLVRVSSITAKKGVIVAMKDKKEAIVEIEGMRIRVKTAQLKHTHIPHQKPKTRHKLKCPKKSRIKMRSPRHESRRSHRGTGQIYLRCTH